MKQFTTRINSVQRSVWVCAVHAFAYFQMEAYPYLWRDMCYCVVPTTKTHGIGEKFAIVSSSCREKTTHNAICVLDMMRALEWERWLIVIVDGCNGDGCLYSYHVLPPPPLLLLYFIYTEYYGQMTIKSKCFTIRPKVFSR